MEPSDLTVSRLPHTLTAKKSIYAAELFSEGSIITVEHLSINTYVQYPPRKQNAVLFVLYARCKIQLCFCQGPGHRFIARTVSQTGTGHAMGGYGAGCGGVAVCVRACERASLAM